MLLDEVLNGQRLRRSSGQLLQLAKADAEELGEILVVSNIFTMDQLKILLHDLTVSLSMVLLGEKETALLIQPLGKADNEHSLLVL